MKQVRVMLLSSSAELTQGRLVLGWKLVIKHFQALPFPKVLSRDCYVAYKVTINKILNLTPSPCWGRNEKDCVHTQCGVERNLI